MSEEIEELRAVRKFVCQCFCDFYMPDGIEPSFCPHCGGACTEVKILPDQSGEGFGYYEEADGR